MISRLIFSIIGTTLLLGKIIIELISQRRVIEKVSRYGKIVPMRYKILLITTSLVLVLALCLSLNRMNAPQPNKSATVVAQGYGGNIPLVMTTNDTGRITAIQILQNNETPAYTAKLSVFLQQFIGKGPHDQLTMGNGIDAISGATISSSGITKAIREQLHHETLPARSMPNTSTKLRYLTPIVFSLLLAGLATAALLLKSALWRWLAMISSFIVLGIILKSMLSIVQVVNTAMLHIPPLHISAVWLITLALGFIPALLIGRLYCGSLCPFALVQELTCRLLPIKLRPKHISQPTDQQAKLIKYILAIILISISALLGFTAPAEIEPFITLFTAHANLTAWLFLGLMLVLSLFYYRFWCIYFCPVGALTGLISKLSFFKLSTSSNCTHCGLCSQHCPTGAININQQKQITVDNAECILCGQCIRQCPSNCWQFKTNNNSCTARPAKFITTSLEKKDKIFITLVSLTLMLMSLVMIINISTQRQADQKLLVSDPDNSKITQKLTAQLTADGLTLHPAKYWKAE